MPHYSVRDAKTNLSRLIAAALDGGEVIITRKNIPMVRLVPVYRPEKRVFGAYKGLIAFDESFNEPLPDEELSGWHTMSS